VVKKLLYRERYEKSAKKDPFRCNSCGEEMDLWKIWVPQYGVIFDEEKRLWNGVYGIISGSSAEQEIAALPMYEQLCFEGL